ncbi:DMT family transporter [Psychromarinibacter sp. C21-152]|uniref:DMT family transporter n=1 Tax=Psychromarinibacter sediminicola TaxID=3033385 RepID=A0AAE3NV57_9RHOB|nr:DMT family transporter [Psychromarinibacter sediminicola]MDF0602681.1 DMT family transporter [Psychromarinibacter sediminicola]
MISTTQSAAIMLAAGVGIPILAALNAGLGQKLGSPIAAAAILFLVALAATGLCLALLGGSVRDAGTVPWHFYLGGLFVAFYVLSITWIAPSFGVGNAVFFVLLGQLLSAAVIDHFGLFLAQSAPITPTRALGIVVMVAGVFLTQIAGRG